MASSLHTSLGQAFDIRTCRILSREEQEKKLQKSGQCIHCGQKTHVRKLLGLEPLTIEGEVYKGHCLRCNPNVVVPADESPQLSVVRKAQKTVTERRSQVVTKLRATRRQHHRAESAGSNSTDDASIFDARKSLIQQLSEASLGSAASDVAVAAGSSASLEQTVSDRPLRPNDSLADVVEGDDVMSGIVRTMRTYPHSAEVQLQCCYSMMSMLALPHEPSFIEVGISSDGDDKETSMMSTPTQVRDSWVHALCNAIKNHPTSPAIQKDATKVLWALLYTSDANRQQIFSSGGIREIMTALQKIAVKHHQRIQGETESVLCFLGAIDCFLELSRRETETAISEELELDLSQIVVEVMRKLKLNIQIQEYGCRILARCSNGAGDFGEMMGAVVDSLNHFYYASDREFQKYAITCLACLCSYMPSDYMDAPVIEVIDVLTRVSDMDEEDHDNFCFVFAALAPRLDMSFVPLSVVQKMCIHSLNAMRSHPHLLSLQKNACSALAHLVHDNNEVISKVRDAGVIMVVRQTMENHAKDLELQMDVLIVLLNLSMNSGIGKSLIVSLGVVDYVVQQMWEHPRSMSLQILACKLLTSLAVTDESLSWVVGSGALAAIAEAHYVMSVNEEYFSDHQQLNDIFCLMCRFSVRACKEESLVSQKVVTAVCAEMGLVPRDEDFLNLALQTLTALFHSGSVLPEKDEADLSSLVASIVKAMEVHTRSQVVQCNCCDAMGAIALSSERAASIVRSEGIERVSISAEHNSEDVNLVEQAVFVMQQVIHAGHLDVIATLTRLLKERSGVKGLQESGCLALWSVAIKNNDSLSSIKSSGGIDVCINGVQRFPDSMALQQGAISLLYMSYCSGNSCDGIISDQILGTLLTALTNDLGNPVFQEMSISLVADFVQSSHLSGEMFRCEDLAESVINAMSSNPDSLCIQQKAAVVLSILTADEQQKRSITRRGLNSDVIRSILLAVRNHRSYVDLLQPSLESLQNFVVESIENKITTDRLGGIPDVISVMQEHIGEVSLQEISCTLLWSLAIHPNIGVAIADAGGISAIVNAMLAHIMRQPVVEGALGALTALSASSNPNFSVLMESVSSHDAIVCALWTHFRIPSVVVAGCNVLANSAVILGLRAEADPLSSRDLETVVSAMIYHRGDRDLQSAACRVLYNYSGSPANFEVFRSNEKIRSLLLWLASNTNVSDECRNRAEYVLQLIL